MANIVCYKEYTGLFEYDDEAGIFHGEILGLDDVVTFQGKSVDELKKAFQDSIEEYLEVCAKVGKPPDKPFSGKFTVRLSPDLHRQVHTIAKAAGKSINEWVCDSLRESVSGA
ncbi:MAG: type II toxin-antitoxin system HicB family antitoxin [bacterium]